MEVAKDKNSRLRFFQPNHSLENVIDLLEGSGLKVQRWGGGRKEGEKRKEKLLMGGKCRSFAPCCGSTALHLNLGMDLLYIYQYF